MDGDGAVLNQLANELNPHVQMLDLVIGLERCEDQRCGLVVTIQLNRQFLFTHQKAGDIEDVQDLEDEYIERLDLDLRRCVGNNIGNGL
jgi:hypothetical protein